MLSLNCQSANNSTIGNSMSNSGSMQSLQSIDSDSPNLAMSPLSTMGMSPVACSPMGMSPMGPHHGYATPVTPSPVHTTHPHNGGLSPKNDLKALYYGPIVYDPGFKRLKKHINERKISFKSLFSCLKVFSI